MIAFRISMVIAVGICVGCATHSILAPPAQSVEEYIGIVRGCDWIHPDAVQDLEHACKRLESNFPLRVGMSVGQVKDIVAEEIELAETDTNRYGFIPVPSPRDSMTYILGQPCWIWVDMAISDGKVRNIFMIGGNREVLVPPGFRFAGEGRHVGGGAEAIKEMMRK